MGEENEFTVERTSCINDRSVTEKVTMCFVEGIHKSKQINNCRALLASGLGTIPEPQNNIDLSYLTKAICLRLEEKTNWGRSQVLAIIEEEQINLERKAQGVTYVR